MKSNYSDKFYAILSYTFLLGFITCFKKNKSSFLKCHLRKGKFINYIILVWLAFVIVLYRLLEFFPLTILNVVKVTLDVINILFVILIFIYQIYWVTMIIKKKV